MTRFAVLALVLFSAIPAFAQKMVRVDPSFMEEVEWTVDLSWSERSNFALFGLTAGSNPVGTAVLTAERGDWAVDLIVVEGIGEQEPGELVDYVDAVVTRSFERGNFTTTMGIDVFYGPEQSGTESATFIAPLATMEWAPNDYLSVLVGGQYVGVHNTDYSDQDRTFVWFEPTFSVGSRLVLSVSPGVVYADTGRSTQYVSGSVEWNATEQVMLYASYLEAKSWDVVGTEGGPFPVRPTWSYGMTVGF